MCCKFDPVWLLSFIVFWFCFLVTLQWTFRMVDPTIYEVHTISFQTFFVWAFKIVVDVIHLMRWLANFYDFRFKWTATVAIGIHPPDYHSWWFSKMQSDTLEERYAIKLCFKLRNNATETYGMLQNAFRPSCMNRVSVFTWHKRFKRQGVCEGWWEVWEE